MAGRLLLGNAEVVQALVKLKSYLDYGMFQPVQIAATVTLNEATDFPAEVCATYEARRDALVDGLDRIGWKVPKPGGSMFVWAPIPEPYADLDSVEFSSALVRDADRPVARRRIRPGRRGFVRFALIENENASPRASATSAAASEAGLACVADHDAAVRTLVCVWLPDRPGVGSRRQPHRRGPRRRAGDRHPRTRRRPGRRRARRRSRRARPKSC